jgi:putative lipoprotein
MAYERCTTRPFAGAALALMLAGCMATEGEGVTPVGPVWIAQEVAGDAVPVETAATLQLGADGRASGKGGCNQYGGPYELAGASISFGALVSTKMACEQPAMDREGAYFEALAKVTHYELRNDAELVLLADDGNRIVMRRSGEEAP